MFRSRRVIDRGQGETDHGQYDEEEYVFGVSGTCPPKSAYGRKNLRRIFRCDFMYKEDVDLAWRFQLFG